MKIRFVCLLLVSAAFALCSTQPGFTQAGAPQVADTAKNSTDAVYQQIRRKGNDPADFSGAVATVNGLVLKRDAATFKFNSGEIYFLTPVEGRVVGAVFLGDVEMRIVPPTEVEKRSLDSFTGAKLFNR